MLHIVTGGAGSGKSAYAEQLIMDMGESRRIYLASMYPDEKMSADEEILNSILSFRELRQNKNFETIICYNENCKQGAYK